MNIIDSIKQHASASFSQLFQVNITPNEVMVNATKAEFEGDYTIVTFAFTKYVKQKPDDISTILGEALITEYPNLFSSFNVVKGFLNLTVANNYWVGFLLAANASNTNKGKVMVEYSSPNTNKPLHLGHLRNNFLGWSVAEILKENGHDVVKTCVVNDRGVHICKSMIAWQLFAEGATPTTTNKKGDHFVGDYYVKFNNKYKEEIQALVAKGMDEKVAEKEAPIMKATQQMLLDWEEGKPEVIALWEKMNSWVYDGFNATYAAIGSDFHKTYYESKVYLLGKDLIEKGLEQQVFTPKEDGSVWIDLTADGLDEKLVRRKDGTSVYITQDIGLAELKQAEYGCEKSIYVVGDEQNYHFKVLKLICQKLALPSADGIEHLSYGMVELPSGKMKSREGTVVDADDLVAEMVAIAKQKTEDLGKVKDFTEAELNQLYKTIGLGALKFFLLRVDPKKKMIFNPEESIEFQGFTGPFVQYTFARIKSILRKENATEVKSNQPLSTMLLPAEKAVIVQLEMYQATLNEAANSLDPSKIAIYVFNLAQAFNSFYVQHSISQAETAEKKVQRLVLATRTAETLHKGMQLLGIEMPERM